jgi:hypothetical protein
LLFLAYEASKQAKIVVPAEFDTYCKQITNVEVIDQEAQNPTQAAPTEGN